MLNIDYSKIPILNIGNRTGVTDYIDFISWDEVTSPVMRGQDIYGREFFVIKFLVDNKIKLMQTFFQRYSIEEDLWQGCGHATEQLIETCGGMRPEQFKFIERIINYNE